MARYPALESDSRHAAVIVIGLVAAPVDLRAQSDTLLVPASAAAPTATLSLAAGERIAVWVESDVEVGDPDVGPGPVGDAAVGEVIARFATSGAFAWPQRPVVWIAPSAGALAFDVRIPGAPGRGEPSRELRLGSSGRRLRRVRATAPQDRPACRAEHVRSGPPSGSRGRPATLLPGSRPRTGVTTGSRVRPGPRSHVPLPPPRSSGSPGCHTLTARSRQLGGGARPGHPRRSHEHNQGSSECEPPKPGRAALEQWQDTYATLHMWTQTGEIPSRRPRSSTMVESTCT